MHATCLSLICLGFHISKPVAGAGYMYTYMWYTDIRAAQDCFLLLFFPQRPVVLDYIV